MSKRELGFFRFTLKLHERLAIIVYHIKTGQDILDEDMQLLRTIFPLWYNGEIVFTESVLDEPSHNVIQQGLFSDKTAGNS